jgi:GDP-L-fucose synthase
MRTYIAGINGMVGSSIVRKFRDEKIEVFGKSSNELDFTNREETFRELKKVSPDVLIIAAAKVGGIGANSTYPVEFLTINLQLQINLLDAAHAAGIKKVIFLGSSCIYPKFAPQPIPESSLLTGPLEPTNEPYAIAKISGVKLVDAYRKEYGHNWISLMPTNMYGPNDNFDIETSHVLPGLLHRFHLAKIQGQSEVKLWGDGTPLREFMHVDDLAKAIFHLLEIETKESLFNIGSSSELSIFDLAKLIARTVGFEGKIAFDSEKPNGTLRKLLDSSLIKKTGWKAEISLEDGIKSVYDWYLNNHQEKVS